MIVTYSGQGIWFAEGFLSGVTRLDGFMQNRNIFCLFLFYFHLHGDVGWTNQNTIFTKGTKTA